LSGEGSNTQSGILVKHEILLSCERICWKNKTYTWNHLDLNK
jgi:hypothetical protein